MAANIGNSLQFLGRDMAVDLGTANTLVYVRGRGIVLNEPSVVAINTKTGHILSVGSEAKRMIGRTPGHIMAIRPLKDGVIADFDVTEKMLRYFIHAVHKRRFLAKPRVVVCVPSGITGVEQRAVEEATIQAGARAAYIIEEPMAAAIGSGLPVHEPAGNMVVDIGGGTTEVAVISLGGIVTSQSIRIGGDELDESIIAYVKKEYSLMLGERTAEEIKMAIGSAFPLPDEPHAEIRGRDLVSGLPKTIIVSADEIRKAIEEPVNAIIDAVKNTLDKTPPELAADIMDKGIVLTGGGGMLKGLDERLKHETGMPIHTTMVLVLINQLLISVTGSWFGRLIDCYGERVMLSISYIVLTLVFLGYGFIEHRPTLYVLYCVDNLVFFGAIALTTYLNKIAPPEDLKPSLSMGVTFNHISSVTALLIGGFAWHYFGYEVIFYAGAVFSIISLGFAQFLPTTRMVPGD